MKEKRRKYLHTHKQEKETLGEYRHTRTHTECTHINQKKKHQVSTDTQTQSMHTHKQEKETLGEYRHANIEYAHRGYSHKQEKETLCEYRHANIEYAHT